MCLEALYELSYLPSQIPMEILRVRIQLTTNSCCSSSRPRLYSALSSENSASWPLLHCDPALPSRDTLTPCTWHCDPALTPVTHPYSTVSSVLSPGLGVPRAQRISTVLDLILQDWHVEMFNRARRQHRWEVNTDRTHPSTP